jgi:phosphatidylglycerophosphate synthase
MKDRYYTIPNLITFYRFLSALFIFFALLVQINKWIVLVVYCIAAITDKLDGVVARRLKQESKFGEVLETFTDTVLSGMILAYVLVNFNFPVMFFIVMFLFFIVGLILATIYFLFKKEWYCDSLITSKISAFITYLACFLYFFDFKYNYYFALSALVFAVIAFLYYVYKISKSFFKKAKTEGKNK